MSVSRVANLLRSASVLARSRARPLQAEWRHRRFSAHSGISRETLFEHTSERWLCNEERHRKARRTPFDPEALERIACSTVSAERCLSWEKIGEGSFNRIFLLRFDNAASAVVRIPCSLVGNIERSILSEVATISYVRDRWGDNKNVAKPPKVLAWSTTHDNPAQTPYMILEYAPGVTLKSRWDHIEGNTAGEAVMSVMALDWMLLHHKFALNGSLYFKEDVPKDIRSQPLYISGQNDSSMEELHKKLEAKYRIGPTANREWWRGGYAQVPAHRGPWPDLQTMIKSAAELQLRAIDAGLVDFSSPRPRYKPSDIPHLQRLLHLCITIAPHIVPNDPDLTAPVLQHPDLSLQNIIVPPSGSPAATHTIDWQGAAVSPFCISCAMPPAIAYDGAVIPVPPDGSMPLWPDGFDALSPSEQEFVRKHHRYACRHRFYLQTVSVIHFSRTKAWVLPHYELLTDLVKFITRCASDGPATLRTILVELQKCWAEFAPDVPCPIDFTPEEVARHEREKEERKAYEKNVAELYEEVGCSLDESVPPDHYETAMEIVERRRAEWDEVAMNGPFPFYEGAHNYFLS
ncbi:hypothetical protein BDW22DRAFT_1427993 [Trametopsis cervina]|nr:hypothetical protein BDW22DRAFT_1427993 [Trametopsis cervina]